jgi:hypothetical protein
MGLSSCLSFQYVLKCCLVQVDSPRARTDEDIFAPMGLSTCLSFSAGSNRSKLSGASSIGASNDPGIACWFCRFGSAFASVLLWAFMGVCATGSVLYLLSVTTVQQSEGI